MITSLYQCVVLIYSRRHLVISTQKTFVLSHFNMNVQVRTHVVCPSKQSALRSNLFHHKPTYACAKTTLSCLLSVSYQAWHCACVCLWCKWGTFCNSFAHGWKNKCACKCYSSIDPLSHHIPSDLKVCRLCHTELQRWDDVWFKSLHANIRER